jgi:hypothetical protein
MSAGWKTVVLLVIASLLAAPASAAPRGRRAAPARKAPKPAPEPPPPPPPVEPQVDSDAAKERAPEPPAAAPAVGPSAPGGGTGSAAQAPEGTTRPVEAKPEKPENSEKSDAPDVDSLRQEYLGLRDELFKSRARANAVASQLYSTRIQIKLTYTTGRYYNPAKASIRLDGASVYEDASGAIAGDDGVRFDGYVAPGRHLITFRVEATGKDDDSFTSTTESEVVVKAVAGKDLVVAARARDSGDIAYEWKRSEKGSYGLGIDVSVKTAKSADPAAAGKGTKK